MAYKRRRRVYRRRRKVARRTRRPKFNMLWLVVAALGIYLLKDKLFPAKAILPNVPGAQIPAPSVIVEAGATKSQTLADYQLEY